MQLNPRWLYGAHVYNEHHQRIGTVSEVKGNVLTVLSRGKKIKMEANKLDADGLLHKPGAVHKKYL